jgi:hypothetical protein
MKKRLEAELISIAHRILKLKNKSELDKLYFETQKLYEALTVLKFYGDNYEQVKTSVEAEDLEEKLSAFINNDSTSEAAVSEVVEELIEETAEVPTATGAELEQPTAAELTEEPTVSESAPDFDPIFEMAAEASFEEDIKETESSNETEPKQMILQDILGDYTEPEFVKPSDIVVPPSLKSSIEEQPLSLNEQHSKVINIGLNDRIAFVKNLFGDSTEDYNRVLSQLNTFTTLEEAKDFIEEIIKPDYNNWEGVNDYAERFIEIVAKKFS